MTELINAVLDHASHLLKSYGEFYPFAIIRKVDGTLQPLNTYEGKEKPSASEHLNQLEKTLQSSFDKYEYDSFGIGVNTSVSKNGEREDVILIRINFEGEDYEDSFVPYKNIEGSIELYDMYTNSSPS